jgi:hypothetical protein
MIGDTEFEIQYLKKVREGIEGEIVFAERVIRVENNDQWFETLFHEMNHAAFHVSGKNKGMSARKDDARAALSATPQAPLVGPHGRPTKRPDIEVDEV